MVGILRRGRIAVYSTALERRHAARHRGFKSHPLRTPPPRSGKRNGKEIFDFASPRHHLGENIKKIRTRKGMSQGDIDARKREMDYSVSRSGCLSRHPRELSKKI